MIASQQNINVTSINVKNHRARTRGAFPFIYEKL